MRTLIFLCIPFIMFSSCTSSGTTTSSPSPVNSPAAIPPETGGGRSVSVDNPTAYNVYFERGQMVGKKSRGDVSLLIEDATLTGGFDILYEIPLSTGLPLFCKGDHRTIRELQKNLTVKEPDLAENYGVFIKLVNKADNAISFYSGGTAHPAWEQQGSPTAGNSLARTDRREFSPDETAVFNISHDSRRDYSIRDSRKNIPLVLSQNKETSNYLYTFEYSARGLELTDSRPLRRAGETGWVKTIDDTEGPLQLAASGNDVHLFAFAKKSVIRHDFDSAGNARAAVPGGDSFKITAAARAGDAFFVAGYDEPQKGAYRPTAKLLGLDGVARRILVPSSRGDTRQGYFLAAAQKDNDTWLLAGAASENAVFGYRAYARLVRDNGAALASVWELAGTDFDRTDSGVICGEIKSAAYDSAGNRWLLTGENIEYDSMKNPVPGAYTVIIGNDGKIQKTDFSFKQMSFNKILAGPDGVYYLAGEEQQGNETRAVLLKYNAGGRQIWRLSGGIPSHSWYEDAVLDTENNRITLGGVLRARNNSGSGGIPFVEAVDTEKGVSLWREELSDPVFAGTSLVTAITPAPDYGFALTLCGVANDYYAKPYMLARINSQGKLVK